MEQLTSELIAIGTEILLGDIVNTNASYIARQLAAHGIALYHQQVVGDNPERVLEAFRLAFSRADIVITTGGLGPTGDDLSKEMGARYFGIGMHEDERARENIERSLRIRGLEVTPNNWKQAMLPEGSIPLYNNHGTAPGFILEQDAKTLIMLPGPPSEMQPMFDEQVMPYLAARSSEVMISRTLHLAGMGESAIEYRLHEMMLSMENPTLAPYAKTASCDLRITARAGTEEDARTLIAPVETKIREMFGDKVYGTDGETLESVVGELLISRGYTVSMAESCTGGLVSGRLINYPGISQAYTGGIVSYSNEVKERQLGVSHETLMTYGAVSEQTAREMAAGARRLFGTDCSVAVTGIAGPGGGTKEKPVGLIYIAVDVRGKIRVRECHLTKTRQENRNVTVVYALDELRQALLHENS